MSVTFSRFSEGLQSEKAFDVLAVAHTLKARGKEVIELQIGDSPFPTTKHAREAGLAAIVAGQTHYCPSPGLPALRQTLASNYTREFGVAIGPENIVIGPGAKLFEQYFCELFLEPGDRVLVFSPHFPTYQPNIERRGAVVVTAPLRQEQAFRPDLAAIEQFLDSHPRARAIFLNSPHNPTGGVATSDDLAALARLIRGRDVAVFSDEPYCHMVWHGRHETLLAQPGMLEQTVACYTFSKSYSMSGWRLGYAVCQPRTAELLGKMVNTTLSCVPPFVQLAGVAAIEHDAAERDEIMAQFRRKVELLVAALKTVPGVQVEMPAGTFYVFPNVEIICRQYGITSHGLAMYLLEGADEQLGIACLGGECFGPAGAGFLRFSCAEPDERLIRAIDFLRDAIERSERVARYLDQHAEYRR